MGKKELKQRGVWQDSSGMKATVAEKEFFSVLTEAFRGTPFRVRAKPKEFSDIYRQVKLSPAVTQQIYNPQEQIHRHGIMPDYAIDNLETKKTLYVEVKRQDGWVEGGKRSDGRGNAHERSCKYFTPGLLAVLRKRGRLGKKALPFWTVFIGDITRDPCRVREVTLWYSGFENHFFFWRDTSDEKALIKHFTEKLQPLFTKK